MRDERTRIARELHDVVAHNVSVMVVQAAAGRRVLNVDPAGTRDALGTIEAAGRQALTELRTLLGALRSEHDKERHLAPQPGLDQLPDLLQRTREAGLAVELRIEGSRRDVPPGVDLSAYRVVQESLTNALKHAGPAHARVVLHYSVDRLDVEVTDDGQGIRGDPHGHGGHGLLGMRERVLLFGGDFSSGPQRGGGFRVHATFPLDGHRDGQPR